MRLWEVMVNRQNDNKGATLRTEATTGACVHWLLALLCT
jgi:hypothetical protein